MFQTSEFWKLLNGVFFFFFCLVSVSEFWTHKSTLGWIIWTTLHQKPQGDNPEILSWVLDIAAWVLDIVASQVNITLPLLLWPFTSSLHLYTKESIFKQIPSMWIQIIWPIYVLSYLYGQESNQVNPNTLTNNCSSFFFFFFQLSLSKLFSGNSATIQAP